MKFKCFFTLTLLLVASSNSFSKDDCSFTESLCVAQNNYSQADIQLNKIYQRIVNKVERDGFEEYQVPKNEIKTSLLNSQRAWLKFRDAHCEAYYRLFSGGTSRNVDALVCLNDMTVTRSKQLQKLYLEL
jgi:uncharacterized protein YecT (DUF1311 family)